MCNPSKKPLKYHADHFVKRNLSKVENYWSWLTKKESSTVSVQLFVRCFNIVLECQVFFSQVQPINVNGTVTDTQNWS